MTLESSKNLGAVGAILMVVSPLGMGAFTGVLGLVGLILLLIAVKGLSDHYREQGIFNNALYGTILIIVGIAATVAILVVTALATLSRMGITLFDMRSWSMMGGTMQGFFSNLANMNFLWAFIGAIVVALVVLFVFLVVAAVFFRKSLSALAKKTKVPMFETAGLLMLIGAALTIILVGFIVMWVALILIAVAFFSIKV